MKKPTHTPPKFLTAIAPLSPKAAAPVRGGGGDPERLFHWGGGVNHG